jgi:hypothetical protein
VLAQDTYWLNDAYENKMTNAIIPDFQVNENAGPNCADQASASISSDANGNFVITWTDWRYGDSADIYAQRYSSEGNKLGENFRVNEVEVSIWKYFYWDYHYLCVSADNNGNFVIVWWDYKNEIYAQRYSSDGFPLGSNFLITKSIKNLSDPDVKLWNGRIYSTWTDNRGNGTGYDIWANVLDWNNPVGISEKDMTQIPKACQLNQNYPNPFNPSTTIKYALSKPEHVTLTVFNTLGQTIETLVHKPMPTGHHRVEFNDQNLPSGLYFYRLEAGEHVQTRKMLLVK